MSEMVLRSMILAAICINSARKAFGQPETHEITTVILPVETSFRLITLISQELTPEKLVR